MPNFFTSALYINLWLVKALRLPATPALLCSDRRCADNRPTHDVTNFKFDLRSFLLVFFVNKNHNNNYSNNNRSNNNNNYN